ncbi:MAG: SGNH/GDSL hydrolase family protein [Neisseria sp.]|nr:SGNH/GDSL hydrolase family protein [Neisseria sp.]
MNILLKKVFSLPILFGLLACSQVSAVPIEDFQDGRAAWQDKLDRLRSGGEVKFRILQLGDSHTGGDYFTQELRSRLQTRWGNGGIGWVSPAAVRGQRTAEVKQKGSGWQVLSSRKDEADFPLGGVLMRSQGYASMSIIPNTEDNGAQEITFNLRPVFVSQPLLLADSENGMRLPVDRGEGFGWRRHTVSAKLPFSFETGGDDDIWEIGPINIENERPGVIVSALGINGSQLSHWSRWRPDFWQDLQTAQADLVVLAYGTNEAFNRTIDVEETREIWRQTVRNIKKMLPSAGILLVGAPESLTTKNGECGQRPAKLGEIQAMQQQIAREEHLLYWSWQDAMGGECSMKNWVLQGLGAKDGVHFSATGYRLAGGKLADALMEMMGDKSWFW